MNVLVLNAGSSSIKYQLITMPDELVLCRGIVERIGEDKSVIKYKSESFSFESTLEITNHQEGLRMIADLLLNKESGVISNTSDIEIVGHRVVHGGNLFSDTTLITEAVKTEIDSLSKLAPLHNPANLEGIILAEQIFSKARQVAVFDTAFHNNIPDFACQYAIPHELSEKHGVQVYGFHGTSHKYVSDQANIYLNKIDNKLITIHLGNGCSITAVENGRSVDHSMGFTPSNGLVMGTRSGDIDHAIIFYLVDTLGYTLEEINTLLLKKSGMLGLTGFSDLRDVQEAAEKGNRDCLLALEINAYRIKKYIGAYAAAMNGVDAIVFTAGIGENSAVLRKMVCTDLDYLGISLDDKKNNIKSSSIKEINTNSSNVKILVIPTNEELEIAKQSYSLCLEK